MKTKNLILGLAVTLTMGLGVTAYAATAETTTNYTHQRAGLSRVTNMRGYDYVESVLKDTLGMTDSEITAGFNSRKTMYDLAKERGMTEDEFKTALLEKRNSAIDSAVSNGIITKEEGNSMKEILKNNMESCTGIPGQRMGSINHGQKGGHNSGRGLGNGSGNCYINTLE